MSDPVNVFILAAGFGERLLPITSHIPKPLLPIAGKPVLQVVLERVSGLFPRNIGINLHHKKELLSKWIERSDFRDNITVFPEERILGTGGALKNAESLLSKGDFLVHNADILSDIDLRSLVDHHRSSANLATLAVHDLPELNNVAIDSAGLLKGVGASVHGSPGTRRMAFTGICVYTRDFLKFLPHGVSSVIDAWMAAIAAGSRVGTYDIGDCYWTDIGTPSAYAAAVIDHMKSDGESVFVHPAAEGCRNAGLDGYVVIEEGCKIGRGVSLRNCVVLPGTDLTTDSSHENCIAGPGFKIVLGEEEILPFSKNADGFLIGSGGSDRQYYRVRGKGSSVLMKFSGEYSDFRRHISYTEFFVRHGIPVPALLEVNERALEALFEDLGDLSLYSWLRCGRSNDEVETLYRKVLDIAAAVHTVVTAHLSECPLLAERIFDYEHLRWETNYFMENFVNVLTDVRIKDMTPVEEDFRRLALHTGSYRGTIIHRDLQSQNIMITRGIPRLIDYQGARTGPPAYDLASLLWDPYYRLEDIIRSRLIDYYIESMVNSSVGFDAAAFSDSLLPCRLQRHMQALGAYGFLSQVKGKKYFLKHVREALRLLKEDVALAGDRYPALRELVLGLRDPV